MSISYFYRSVLVHGAFAVLKILFVLMGGASLFFEEAQYWLWSKHLDLSYYSKPPLIAWVNYLSTAVFGNTEFAIRINAILCGFLIGMIVFLLARRLFMDERKAFWSSVLLLAFPYFWIISYYFTTDSLVTLFWTWAVYALYMAVNKKTSYWIWLGIAVGLGFLSKYVIFFFWPMALVYIFVYHRQTFSKPFIYLSVLLSAVFLIPVVYWNYMHDWVTIRHLWALSGGNGESSSIDFLKTLEHFGKYVGGQLGFWLLLFIVPVWKGFKGLLTGKANSTGYFLLVPVLFVFAVFLALSLRTKVEVNWTFFVLPPLAIFVVGASFDYATKYLTRLFIASGLMILFLSIPLLSRFIDIPSDLNPHRRLFGWKPMVSEVSEFLMNQETQDFIIVGDSYKTASMLSFYLPGNPSVHDFSPENRMNQFDIWEHHDQQNTAPARAVYIGKKPPLAEDESKAFGKRLSAFEVVRPYNSREGEIMHVIVYDRFYGLADHTKTDY